LKKKIKDDISYMVEFRSSEELDFIAPEVVEEYLIERFRSEQKERLEIIKQQIEINQ